MAKPRTRSMSPLNVARTLAMASDAIRAASESVMRTADAIKTVADTKRERKAAGGRIGFRA